MIGWFCRFTILYINFQDSLEIPIKLLYALFFNTKLKLLECYNG